jgi:hypothetical protein
MARIEDSIEIRHPVDKIFDYTTKADSWPEWQSFVTEATQISQGPMRIGSTFKGVVRMMGLSMKWTKNITCSGIRITEQVTYEPLQESTKFTIVYGMKIGGFMKPFSPMIVSTMRKETTKSLADLKSILEAQN